MADLTPEKLVAYIERIETSASYLENSIYCETTTSNTPDLFQVVLKLHSIITNHETAKEPTKG